MYQCLKKFIREAAYEALGEKEYNRGKKALFWNYEIEKEIQNKKQVFLTWLSTKSQNDKILYKIVDSVTSLINEF